MRPLLVALTAAEITLVVVVLAVYLHKIAGSLRATAGFLGKTNFGVRAIESQCAPIGPAVTRINAQLGVISSALGGLADLAEGLPTQTNGRDPKHTSSRRRRKSRG
ncbi:MAG TPA: hypothetical protein VM324_16885 [Egibacteraceae bacterium]|jgi:hypothetical protein|nr:hypothetical protein [Egibacteraceae bacterium]